MPAFWNVGNTGGATLTWATDQHRSGLRSLKIEKTTTGDSASFVSDNMCDIWSGTHTKNVDIFLGAWVRTSGVNTAPATEDAKWYIVHEFYDSAGVKMGAFKLAIPQTSASTGAWVADTCMPGDVDSAEGFLADDREGRCRKECDRNGVGRRLHVLRSCGTVGRPELGIEPGIPDGLVLLDAADRRKRRRTDDLGTRTRWSRRKRRTAVCSSLKFDLPFSRQPQDGFVGMKRVSLGTNVKVGDVIRITAYLKGANLVPDSAALYPGTWSVGLTPSGSPRAGTTTGTMSCQSNDYTWQFPAVTSFDWTPYTLDLVVPTDAKVLEVRLHVYSRFTGTIYWDDVTINVIGAITTVRDTKNGLPKSFELGENYPNPFNPSTKIQFGLPTDAQASIVIYNTLGQKVRTLVDEYRASGRYEVSWDGRDDLGRTVGSGVYLYRLVSGQTSVIKKMLLVK